MNDREQIQHFADDLDNLVDRYRKEYEISMAGVVGTLQMKIFLLCAEAEDREDEV